VAVVARYRHLVRGILAGLRRVRRAKKLSQAACARLIGVSQPRWSEFERGLVMPSLPAAILMASVLGVTLDSLIPADVALPGRPARRRRRPSRPLTRPQGRWLHELAKHVPGFWGGAAFNPERVLASLPATSRQGRRSRVWSWRHRLVQLEALGILVNAARHGGWLRLEKTRWRRGGRGGPVGSPDGSPQPLTT
jgi:transcriptional regulator with XRE-family HTH domain